MLRNRLCLVLILALLIPSLVLSVASAESRGRLIVFTTDFCTFCKDFMQTVGVVYPKTEIGKRFPMVVVNQFATPKEWEDLAWEIRFFPTFLIMDQQNKIMGRFRGYRGEEFFWSDLETIAAQMPSGQ